MLIVMKTLTTHAAAATGRSIRVPEDLWRAARDAAEATDPPTTVSAVITAALRDLVQRTPLPDPPPAPPPMSNAERRRAVADLVRAGVSNQDIATRLNVSVRTVSRHRAATGLSAVQYRDNYWPMPRPDVYRSRASANTTAAAS